MHKSIFWLLPLALLLSGCKTKTTPVPTIPQQLTAKCAALDMAACNDLGYVYENALGVTKDIPKAFALYDSACARNHPGACNNVGRFYAFGTQNIVPVNLNKALELFEKSCASGEKSACNNRDIILLRTQSGKKRQH